MGTRYRGSAAEVRALNAFIKLNRATSTLGARLSAHLDLVGLTECQFGVLEALHHLGPMSQKELGGKLLRSGGNMTLVIDNLQKRGLVRRERSQEDRRVVIIHLTEQGRRLIGKLFPRHVERIVAELSVLTPAEQDELGRLCKKLGTRG